MGPVEVLWDEDGIPLLWTDRRQTPVKTLPSRRTTYANGNNIIRKNNSVIHFPKSLHFILFKFHTMFCTYMYKRKKQQWSTMNYLKEWGHLHIVICPQ